MRRGLALFVLVCAAPVVALACFSIDLPNRSQNGPGTGSPTNQQRCEEAGGTCMGGFLGNEDAACQGLFGGGGTYNGINCGPGAGLCCVPLDAGPDGEGQDGGHD